MKRSVEFAMRLYPTAWRKRYGSEFEALLDDVNPGWRELFDVVGGALKMQLTTGSIYLKFAAAFALFGAAAALTTSFLMPKMYVSKAVLRMSPDLDADLLARLETDVLSRTSLSEIIQRPSLKLYLKERRTQPLEDVIEAMRRRYIHIVVVQPGAVQISFSDSGQHRARAVVNALVSAFVERAVRLRIEGTIAPLNLEVLDPASLPNNPVSPNRPAICAVGVSIGLLFGLVVASFIKHTKRAFVFASLGIAGGILAGTGSLLIPNEYVSNAAIRIAPFDSKVQETLNKLAKPGLSIHTMAASRQGAVTVVITDRDRDPRKAHSAVSEAILSLSMGSAGQQKVEVLDRPQAFSLPSFPNRLVISLLGLFGGFLVAAIGLAAQHRRLKHA